MNVGQRKHEQATLMLAESLAIPEEMRGRVREVLRLYVPTHHRKKGLATALMRDVCMEADRAGFVLMLWPRQYGDGEMETQNLIGWYRKFGFIETQEAPVLMMRQPRVAVAVGNPVDVAAARRRSMLANAINRTLN